MSQSRSPDDRWLMRCDRPGCEAHVEGIGKTEREQRRDAVVVAERKGWQIGPHGTEFELCSMHIEPTLAMPMKRTPLYNEYNEAISYRGRR